MSEPETKTNSVDVDWTELMGTVTYPDTEQNTVIADDDPGEPDEMVEDTTAGDAPKPKPDAGGDTRSNAADDWDRRRQEFDQKIANERKAREAAEAKVADAMKRVDELSDRIKDAETKRAEAPATDEEDDLPADELEVVPKLAQHLKSLKADLKAAKTEAAEARKLATEAKSESDSAKETVRQKEQDAVEEAAAKATLGAELTRLDAKYGKKFHAEAVEAAKKYIAEKGHTPEDLGSKAFLALVSTRLEVEYATRAAKAGTKAAPAPRKKSGIATDSHSGGSVARISSDGQCRDPFEAANQMLRDLGKT